MFVLPFIFWYRIFHVREDLSSLTAYASSSRLSADLGRACVDKEGADVFIVARDRSRFLAHKAVVSSRSEVLGGLLADAAASERSVKAEGEALVLVLSTFFQESKPLPAVVSPRLLEIRASLC